jgi:uncharacterized GH25 family protein
MSRSTWGSQLAAIALMACLATMSAASAPPASAHEFWIDPVPFTPKVGKTVPIVLRIGSNFEGSTYPYVRELDRRFSVIDARGETRIKTVDGDDPAAEVTFTRAGLSIVAHQRAPEIVVFDDFARFEDNLAYEGLEHLIGVHKSSGRPLTGIRDAYSRYAKALVSVGGGAGNDRAIGLPLELVADLNPYAVASSTPLPVRLLYAGKPLAGVLVKCFHRDSAQTPVLVRSDADGHVAFDISRPGAYLISAVHMTDATPADNAEWVSLWATLTFARP